MITISVSIEIPLPPKGCSPNLASHRHWSKRAKDAKDYRAVCARRAEEQWPGGTLPVRATISTEWFMGLDDVEIASKRAGISADRCYRPRDVQNAIASLKAAVDGLVDARIFHDDTARWLDWGSTVLHRTQREHHGRSGVVLTIESEVPE